MIAITASLLNLTRSLVHEPHRRTVLDSASGHLTTLIVSIAFSSTPIIMAFLLRVSLRRRRCLNAKDEFSGGVCAICLDDGNRVDRLVRKLTECNHGFHTECIDEWLKHRRTCPLCRRRIKSPRRRGSVVTEFVGCLCRRALRRVCNLMDLYLDSQLASAFCDDDDDDDEEENRNRSNN